MDSNRKRILIVEDSPMYRKLFERLLRSQGYETLSAGDGLEGFQVVKREKPDLVLLDLMLPGMDGHKVCRLIKFDRELQHIPVVVLTARDREEDAELVKKSKGDAFIGKTTRTPIILDVIKELLERATGSSAQLEAQ